MERVTSTPSPALKRLIEVARQSGPEGSHPATKALVKRPKKRGVSREVQFARVGHGKEA